MANLTDADKVIRNDVGKSIASKLDDIADAIVAQGGGAHSLDQLSDVDIDSQTLAAGQSIVYNDVTEKFENGEVSTVAALDDLTDVSITSAQQGDSLRNDGNGNWINEPTTVKMTLAEWNAIADKQAWRNAHKNTYLVITDAPNLNATAQDISYDGSTDTVWDILNPTAYDTTGLSYPSGVSLVCGGYFKMGNICIVNMRLFISSSLSGTLVEGLPLPLDVTNNMVAITNNKLIDIGLLNNGYINASTATSGVVILATVYLCQG